MKYELTFKNKLYLMFHQSYIDRMSYLIPKVENHSIKYFEENNIRKPLNFYKYVLEQTKAIIFEYTSTIR